MLSRREFSHEALYYVTRRKVKIYGRTYGVVSRVTTYNDLWKPYVDVWKVSRDFLLKSHINRLQSQRLDSFTIWTRRWSFASKFINDHIHLYFLRSMYNLTLRSRHPLLYSLPCFPQNLFAGTRSLSKPAPNYLQSPKTTLSPSASSSQNLRPCHLPILILPHAVFQSNFCHPHHLIESSTHQKIAFSKPALPLPHHLPALILSPLPGRLSNSPPPLPNLQANQTKTNPKQNHHSFTLSTQWSSLPQSEISIFGSRLLALSEEIVEMKKGQ